MSKLVKSKVDCLYLKQIILIFFYIFDKIVRIWIQPNDADPSGSASTTLLYPDPSVSDPDKGLSPKKFARFLTLYVYARNVQQVQ